MVQTVLCTLKFPVLPPPGNHEYSYKICPQWNHQFAFPENGPDNIFLRNTVYYIDYQGVRFISLNTKLMENPYFAKMQRNWFKSIMAENPNKWTVVIHHHPMASGSHGRYGHFMLNLAFKAL